MFIGRADVERKGVFRSRWKTRNWRWISYSWR